MVRDVGIQESEVELHMHGFFIKLARKIHPRFRRVDVLIQIQHQVVGYDRISGGEERH